MNQYIASWNVGDTDDIQTVLINKAHNYDVAIENINKYFPNATCINIDVRGRERGYPKPTGIINCDSKITCDHCSDNNNCSYAFDKYNTDGDCLASK